MVLHIGGAVRQCQQSQRSRLEREGLVQCGPLSGDLSGANLSGVNLYGAILSRARLAGAYLERVNLSELRLVETDFSENEFSKAEASVGHLFRRTIGGGTLVVARLVGACADGDTVWPEGFDPVDAGVIFKTFD